MTLVYLLIRADHGKEGLVKTALSKFPEITEFHEIFGRYDIIAKVETESTDKFRKFINNKIRILEGIKSTEPLFAAEDGESSE